MMGTMEAHSIRLPQTWNLLLKIYVCHGGKRGSPQSLEWTDTEHTSTAMIFPAFFMHAPRLHDGSEP